MARDIPGRRRLDLPQPLRDGRRTITIAEKGPGMHVPRVRAKSVLIGVALGLIALGLLPAAASAGGRMILTGHDADFRCGVTGAECHFIEAAVRYVRNGAPDPSRPILVLDNADLQ